MPGWEAFIFGAIGSLLVELNNLIGYFQRGRPMPSRYQSARYVFIRFLLVLGAGFIAFAHDAQTKILAVHLGAATPLIIQAFSRSAPESSDA